MSYRISFIEDDDAAKLLVTDRLESEEEFQIVDIPLFDENNVPIYSVLKDLVEDILDSKLDAIIIDYSFVDRGFHIKFDGADLAEEIQRIMPGFPIFVLSAKEEAESSVPDVNLVYDKEEYLESEPGKLKLNNRIKLQIENYRKKVSDAECKIRFKSTQDSGLKIPTFRA